MVKLSILIKGIVLYIIFVLGISMISEWLEVNRNKRNPNLNVQLDNYLASIKNEILQKFAKENFSENEIELPLPISQFPQIQQVQGFSEEDKIIKAVNDRLMYSEINGNDNNVYSNLCNSNTNPQLASANNFNYSDISPMIYNPQKQYIPKYTRFPIENSTYSYT